MEKLIKLYTYVDGVHDTPFPNEESQAEVAAFRSDYKRMGGAPSISCTIMHHLCLDKMWTYNVYATFNGEKFFIKQIPSSSFDNTNARYKHEVELVSERIVLDNVYFYDVVDEADYSKPVSNSTSFTFFGDIHEFAHRLNQSLKYSKVGYNVVVDDGISSEAKQVSFQDQVFSNVLQEAFNTYEIPYYFDGKTIHIGFTNNAITKTFKYGSDESLLSIQKQNANYKIVNRVTGVGSSDNIPYYYPNFDEKGVTRLLYNGEVGGVSVTNKTRYKKVKLGDTFVYDANPTITKELFNKKDYKLGYYSDLYTPEEEGLEPGFTRFQVQFSYSFYLNEMQQVRLDLNSLSDNSIRIDFTVVRQEGGYMEQFFDKNHFEGRLGQGTYNVLITWEFKDTMSPNAIQDWQMKEIIDRDFVAYGATIKQGYVSWMYNNAPVRLYDYGMEVNVEPNDGDKITFERVSYLQPQESLMPSIYRETNGENRFYNALNNTYVSPQTGEYYHFNNPYINGKPKEHIVNFEDIKPTIKGMTNSNGLRIDMFTEFAYDLNDNDEFDEEGNYLHPYFFGKLRRMDGAYGFNLFDHAIEEGEMVISMTSGACGSCEWIIGVSEDRQENIVQVDERGNLLRDANGNVIRSGSAQPQQNDTRNNEVWIALKKDISTFGVVMPNANANYKPQAGDTFVILHIDLPQAYILDAENRLKEELIKYMATNNDEKFNFSISFSRIFFAENPDILAQLNENARLQIEYDGERYELYVSSYSYSMSDGNPLPEIRVELTDTITISQNAIQTAIDSVKQDIMSSVGSIDFLKMGLAYFLRKDVDDRSKGKIASDKGIEVGNYVSGASGAIIYKDAENGQTVAEFDKLYVRMKAYFETLEIINVNTIGGKQIISPAGSVKCIGVEETDNAYRCYFLAEQDGEKVQNRFLVYDQIYSQMFDAVEGTSQNVSTHYFWRLCIAKSKEPVTFENKYCHYIDLSKTDCDKDSDVPMVGDVLNQRGNRTDLDRMNFIEMSSVDAFSPNITLFHGVNSYSLDGKAYVSYGVDKSTNKAFMDVYGDMYVGDRQNGSYMRYTQENGLEISGTLSVGTKLGDTPLKDLISASSLEGYQEFVEKVTQEIEGLQAQIDGAIESYFFQYDPTLGNYPASEWVANGTEKAHLNDTFTNLTSGYSWRWSLDGTTYKWVEITDTATTKALALAGQAKDTADGKRRVFVDTPYPPYDKGDLWSRGSEYPLMICVKTKDKNGVYEASDFDYADNNAKLKEEMQDLVNDTKDDLNNAIGQAKDEAVNNANAYTDEGKKALQASIDAMESTKANLDDVYTRAQADGKISETEAKALKAAEEEADAAIAYYDTIVKAYSDGVATEEELKEIQGAKAALDAAKKYAEEQAQQAIDEANDTYGYLAKALGTEVDGGLLLTSLIQMRDTDQNIMSGINGLTAKGDKSIATWWGGGMYDMFDYYDWDGAKWVAKKNIQIPTNVPSGVIRMDGTGYLAKGKFWWDESGKIYADPTALFLMFDVEDESASLSQTILAMRDKQTEFESMWEFKTDANGRKYLLSKYPLVTQEGITMYSGVGTNIPSIYDGLPIDGVTIYWDNGILKAAGGGGTGGGGSIDYPLSWSGFSSGSFDGSAAKTIYIPSKLSELTNDSGFLTSVSWNNISNKPTTLSGYGITDGDTWVRRIDDRSTNPSPYESVYTDRISWHLKYNETIGVTGESTYSGVLLLSPWSTKTGGSEHQLAFGGNGGIYHRFGASAWNSWDKIITQTNLSSALSEYLPLVGGTLKGNLVISPNGVDELMLGTGVGQLRFQNTGETSSDYSSIHANKRGQLLFTDASLNSLKFLQSGNSTKHTIYHSGNLNPSDYLPKSGGTITGTGTDVLHINSTYGNVNDNGTYIILQHNGVKTAEFGHGWGLGTYIKANKYNLRINNDGIGYVTNNVILHEGNYSSYALPLTGGRIDGASFLPLQINSTDASVVRSGLYITHNGGGKAQIGWDGHSGWGTFLFNYSSNGVLGITDGGTPYFGVQGGNLNTIIHSGNIGSQSVSYASNADKLDGLHLYSPGSGTGGVAYIGGDGVMEVSSIIDFRSNNSDGNDFNTRLYSTGSYKNQVQLPTSSGTLALITDNVASATNADKLGGFVNGTYFAYRGWDDSPGKDANTASMGSNFTYGNNAPSVGPLVTFACGGYDLQFNAYYYAPMPLSYRVRNGDHGVWNDWKTIATTDSNVASATKLQTARTIWGQSFDGTGNVGGELILNDTLAFSGKVNVSYETYINNVNQYGLRIYYSNGNEGMMLKQDGNVGIGTTNPSEKLHVVGKIYATSGIGTDGGLSVIGNVGIGTTNPDSKLHVNGDLHIESFSYFGNQTIITRGDKTYDTAYIAERTDINRKIRLGIGQSNNRGIYDDTLGWIFKVAPNDKINIGNGNYIGIGTDNPYYNLDISGTFNASSNASIGGTLYVAGKSTLTAATFGGDNGINIGMMYNDSTTGAYDLIERRLKDSILYLQYNHAGGVNMCNGGGTTTLGGGLRVKSTSTFTGKTTHNGGLESTVSSAYAIYGNSSTSRVCIAGDNGKSLYIASKGNSADYYLVSVNYGQTTLGSGGSNAFTIRGDGNVGIGQNAPSAKLHVAGNILTSGSITMNSMRSMKNIINENGLSLEELSTIKPTRFTWKDGRDDRIHVGGIADDVMKVLPEVVFKGSDGVLSMDYASAAFVMAASLIQPMTEHERRIANLERENALLKEEIRNLKSA